MKTFFIKHLLPVLVLCGLAIPAGAQCMTEQDGVSVSRQRHANTLTLGCKTLDHDETLLYIGSHLGADKAAAWEKASKRFRTGRGLLIGFGSTAATGALMIAGALIWDSCMTHTSCTDGFYPSLLGITGGFVAIVGVVGMFGGTGVYCVAQKRMNAIVDDLNAASTGRSTRWSLNVGQQKHGIGLAVNF